MELLVELLLSLSLPSHVSEDLCGVYGHVPKRKLCAHVADRWSFIAVGAHMGAKVVSTSELLGAKMALEACGILLYSARLLVLGDVQTIRVRKVDSVVVRI